MVLICISLIISDAEHIFLGILAICMSVLEKCLFRFTAEFSIGLFGVLLLSCMSYLHTLEISPLYLQIFSPILWVVFFVLFMVSFAMQKLLSLISSHLFLFLFSLF